MASLSPSRISPSDRSPGVPAGPSSTGPAPHGPPSPPATRIGRARWSDPRLGVGIVLVCASVAIGSRVVAAADDSRAVWALTRDLAAGSTLTSSDVTVRHVRLDGVVNPYVAAAGSSPVGAVLGRDLTAGELLPAAAVAPAGRDAERLVTVPVGRDRLPLGLEPGQRVDVYVSSAASATAAAAASGAARQVLAVSGARVDEVEQAGRYGGEGRVVLAVPPARVAGLVSSIAAGSVDLVRVP